jgi:hypothetical protein
MPPGMCEAAVGFVSAEKKMCGLFERTAITVRDAAQPWGCGVKDRKRLFIFGINLWSSGPGKGPGGAAASDCLGRAAC